RMGARPLGRVIQEHIKKPLAEEVLFGKLRRGGTVKVTVETKEDGETGLKLETIPDDAPVKPKRETPPARKGAAKRAAPKKAKPKAAKRPPALPEPPKRSLVPQLPRKS